MGKKQRIIGAALSIVCLLCGCKKEETDLSMELVTNLSPVTIANDNASNITEEVHGDYVYWMSHKINNSDRVLWDMTSNNGDGCKLGNFIYNTQIVNATDFGYELGYPLHQFISEKVTEQNTMWAISGLELGVWKEVEDGSKIKYDSYVSTAFTVKDLNNYDWYFIVNDYTITTDSVPETQFFNILGVTEYMGDWLTIELTGNYTSDDEYKAEYEAILGEFGELYGFCELFDCQRKECAGYLMDVSTLPNINVA